MPSQSNFYKYGFESIVDMDSMPPGLNEETVLSISEKRSEPDFMREFRINAYRQWEKMKPPTWGEFCYPCIDFQKISYFSAPKKKSKYNSLDEVDPEILKTFDRLGIPLHEQKVLADVAVDAVFDSVSVFTTFREKLFDHGVIFCSISEAIIKYPELIKKYMGSVVPFNDNFFAALNAAVFSDGSFVYVPKGVKCPLDLVTYFRINDALVGQFERTLIIADEFSSVSYLEGCSAPLRQDHQLHAAVVELVALKGATVKYSTVQNWFPGDPESGNGGILNFVTKRGKCVGDDSKISWYQVELGSAITWKYPSVIMYGDRSVGEFFSVALTTGKMCADTGTKMIHIGNGTRSTIISKGIAADTSKNTYRGLVSIIGSNSRNYTQCDSMLIGDKCSVNTLPDIMVKNSSSFAEHEASTSKMDEEVIFYLQSRGLSKEEAIQLVVTGFCKGIIDNLPLEFASEMQILGIRLENSVG